MRAKRLLPCVALLVLLLSAGAWAETEDTTEQEPAGYVALTFDDGPSETAGWPAGAWGQSNVFPLRISNGAVSGCDGTISGGGT